MTIADDGKGIPQEVIAKFSGGAAHGIGLAGMRERLAEFAGQINVESSSGGSVLVAVIPTACTTKKEEYILLLQLKHRSGSPPRQRH
jgi:signal transduction histidine kinase